MYCYESKWLQKKQVKKLLKKYIVPFIGYSRNIISLHTCMLSSTDVMCSGLIYQVAPRHSHTSSKSNTFIAMAFPPDPSVKPKPQAPFLMGQKPISSWWIRWSPFTFFHFIFLNSPDYEPTTWSDEHLYTGLFRLPDIHPFMLFDSDMWVSQFCFTCWARKTNVPSTVSRVLVPSRTSHCLFHQPYIFVGSHFLSLVFQDILIQNSVRVIVSLLLLLIVWTTISYILKGHTALPWWWQMKPLTVYFWGTTIPSPTHLPYHLSPKPPNLDEKSGPGTISVVVSSWSHWSLRSTTSKRQVDKYISKLGPGIQESMTSWQAIPLVWSLPCNYQCKALGPSDNAPSPRTHSWDCTSLSLHIPQLYDHDCHHITVPLHKHLPDLPRCYCFHLIRLLDYGDGQTHDTWDWTEEPDGSLFITEIHTSDYRIPLSIKAHMGAAFWKRVNKQRPWDAMLAEWKVGSTLNPTGGCDWLVCISLWAGRGLKPATKRWAGIAPCSLYEKGCWARSYHPMKQCGEENLHSGHLSSWSHQMSRKHIM